PVAPDGRAPDGRGRDERRRLDWGWRLCRRPELPQLVYLRHAVCTYGSGLDLEPGHHRGGWQAVQYGWPAPARIRQRTGLQFRRQESPTTDGALRHPI